MAIMNPHFDPVSMPSAGDEYVLDVDVLLDHVMRTNSEQFAEEYKVILEMHCENLPMQYTQIF